MQGTGKDWVVKEIVGSHNSAFLKKTEEAAAAVEAFVDGFLKLTI